MLQKLRDLLVGKGVRITDTLKTKTSRWEKTFGGTCKTIYPPARNGDRPDHFDLELEDGRRVGFLAQIVTSDSVDGKFPIAGARRKIQVV